MTDFVYLFIPGRPGGHITYKTIKNKIEKGSNQAGATKHPADRASSTIQSNNIADHTQWPASLIFKATATTRAQSARSLKALKTTSLSPLRSSSSQVIRAGQTTRHKENADKFNEKSQRYHRRQRDTRCRAAASGHPGRPSQPRRVASARARGPA